MSLTALQVYKFALVFPPHLSALDALILWGGTMLALGAKIAGYRAILAKDVHAFRKAHTAWHLASAGLVLALLIRLRRAALIN